MPDRRTFMVLGALVMGMTLTSTVLLVLEPGPVAPMPNISLQRTDSPVQRSDKLFGISEPRSWRGVVIHDSGSLDGSSRAINQVHERLGRGGLGYHFVINNGTAEDDGLIEVGFRWQRQFAGAYLEGDGSDLFNQQAVGICMVGDLDRRPFTGAQLKELVWLVHQLQTRFGIPKNEVYVQVGSAQDGTSKRFPHAWFRDQMVSVDQP